MYNNYDKYEQQIVDKMLELGFHISNKGFDYILYAVKIIWASDVRPKFTGRYGLYSEIAEKYNDSAPCVERCVRAEIDRYYNDNTNVPNVLTGDQSTGKLTNSEFLARLSNLLHSEIVINN